MALAVSPRSAAEAPAGLVQPVRRVRRAGTTLRLLAPMGALGYGLTLIFESWSRVAPTLPGIEVATIASAAVALLVCVSAWVSDREDTGLLLGATLAPVVIAVRALIAPVLSALELSTLSDVVSEALGFVALAGLAWTASATILPPAGRLHSAQRELFRRVVEMTALVLFAVTLSGAMVRAVGASWACRGAFPDCNGLGMLPFGRDPLADIQLYHRLLSYVAFGLVAWLSVESFRTQRSTNGATRWSVALVVLTGLDAAVGALAVSAGVPPLTEVMHAAVSTVTWSAVVVLAAVAYRAPTITPRAVAWPRARTLAAYVQLTKPRVMSLLLATTAAAMVIAARGMPDVGLLIATLLGGALMSGGAGAINHYVDRDIDPLMGRTAWRPIPSGVIAPKDALRFGIALAVVASAILLAFVNVIACVLALLGLLGYVFIYTLWLKRSTPSNIVIGGAAGAIPPLVGWAAVTNEIGSLTAWYLFAIIFFWTPPHFWALSLLIRKHYERAGVPMLPVVRGEDETRRQIVLYSLLLVALTLVLSPFGMMGLVYFGAAVVLGAIFAANAFRLWREATPQAARRLYLYSILYLFALFAAMAVDRVLSA